MYVAVEKKTLKCSHQDEQTAFRSLKRRMLLVKEKFPDMSKDLQQKRIYRVELAVAEVREVGFMMVSYGAFVHTLRYRRRKIRRVESSKSEVEERTKAQERSRARNIFISR